MTVESKRVIFGFKIIWRVFSLSFREKYSPSKINLIFYGVAKKVKKFKGLAAGICGIQ